MLIIKAAVSSKATLPPKICPGSRQSANGMTEVDVLFLNGAIGVIRQVLNTPCRQGYSFVLFSPTYPPSPREKTGRRDAFRFAYSNDRKIP